MPPGLRGPDGAGGGVGPAGPPGPPGPAGPAGTTNLHALFQPACDTKCELICSPGEKLVSVDLPGRHHSHRRNCRLNSASCITGRDQRCAVRASVNRRRAVPNWCDRFRVERLQRNEDPERISRPRHARGSRRRQVQIFRVVCHWTSQSRTLLAGAAREKDEVQMKLGERPPASPSNDGRLL